LYDAGRREKLISLLLFFFVKITPIGVELLWGFFLIFHHWIKIDVIWMNMRII